MTTPPPPTETEIRSMLSNASYCPSQIPKLEAYLTACVAGDVPYMFDACRQLIKLYQLFPEKFQETNCCACLLLAMIQFPYSNNSSTATETTTSGQDLLALSYMVPAAVMQREPCRSIRKCGECLDSCQFVEFWKCYEDMLQSFVGDEDDDPAIQSLANRSVVSIQESILTALSFSYKEVAAETVVQYLNLDSIHDVPTSASCVERVTADSVVFVATQYNTKRQRVYQEGVNFSTISSLLNKIAQ